MRKELLDKLDTIAPAIYSEICIEFGYKLLEELDYLNLDDDTLIGTFFLRVNLDDDKKRQLLLKSFGDKSLKIIEILQRLSLLRAPDDERKIQLVRKRFLELNSDLKIIIIKLHERLEYLKECQRLKSQDLQDIADDCLKLYAPIAHRLGIRRIYNPMEDICFSALYPDDFARLNKNIESRRKVLEQKLENVRRQVQIMLAENGITASVQYRVKRLYSIFLKVQKQRSANIDQIFDLMAIRIITNKIEDCYLALGIVHRTWAPIENRFRDWVSFPKPNGYRSIQTTVITNSGDKFEIQIRTEQMHREAEYGSAAHWAYKEGVVGNVSWEDRLKEFLENDEYFDNPQALEELLKTEAKRDFIHVLTPNGDVITLPYGATAIDFAYSIHTEVGSHSTGARINNKFARLKTELNSGDVVSIITNKNAKPSRDWLNYVKTPSARSKIALWIKKNEAVEIIADGKRVWERFKKKYRTKLEGIDQEAGMKKNLPQVGFKSPDDFYSAIGMNSLKCSLRLIRRLFPEAYIKKTGDGAEINKNQNKVDQSDVNVIVDGIDRIKISLARCCNPINGEKIFAYVGTGVGIKIHSYRCKYFADGFFEPDRIKKAEWAGVNEQVIKLKVYGYDYLKLLTGCIEIAEKEKISIVSTTKLNDVAGDICLLLELKIKNYDQFEHYITKLEAKKIVNHKV